MDLRVRQELFPQQFAADVPPARRAADGRRPAPYSRRRARRTLRRTIPSYFLIPTGDKNIPPAAQTFMAERAHAVVAIVKDASHAVLVSKPGITAGLIERAAKETT